MSINYQRFYYSREKINIQESCYEKAAHIHYILHRIFPDTDAYLCTEHHGLSFHCTDDIQRTPSRQRPLPDKLCRYFCRPYAKMSASADTAVFSAYYNRTDKAQTSEAAFAVFISSALLFFCTQYLPHFQTVLCLFYISCMKKRPFPHGKDRRFYYVFAGRDPLTISGAVTSVAESSGSTCTVVICSTCTDIVYLLHALPVGLVIEVCNIVVV